MRHMIASPAAVQADIAARGRQGSADFAFSGIVGESRAIRSAVDYVRKIAQSDTGQVLMVGAPGTGKSLFARAMHYASPRSHLPFVSLDCRSTPATMLEAELFGYEAGAFEGATERKSGLLELVQGGTIVIEDIASLPVRLQPKLLRALSDRRVRRVGGREEYEIGCRVLTTSNRPLEELTAQGSFRDDLYHALNDTRVSLPTLRERGDDVLVLARHFLAEIQREQGLLPTTLGDDAIHELLAYEWPGNARELRATMQQAMDVVTGTVIRAQHLSIQRRDTAPMVAAWRPIEISLPAMGWSLDEVERTVIERTLEAVDGNLGAAARMLEISSHELAEKIRAHRLLHYVHAGVRGVV